MQDNLKRVKIGKEENKLIPVAVSSDLFEFDYLNKSYFICTSKSGQLMQQLLILWGAQKSKSSKISLKILTNKLLVV